ncbi:hypothetical protein QQ045_000194 [Rhodiola kirilowii]
MDGSYTIDVDMLVSFSDDLLDNLKNMNDLNSRDLCLKQSASLQYSCDSSYHENLSSIQDYQRKIDACKLQSEKAKSEVVDDSEISSLERDLADEEKREGALNQELRVIVDELSDLEQQRISIEERKKKLQEAVQDEKRAVAMLSFYASVTNIIPDLDNKSKISGHIVNRDRKAVRKFEMDAENQTAFDTCNMLWKTIDM